MREFIINNFGDLQSIDYTIILLNNVISLIISFFIMFTYKMTYSGASYSRRFNISLGMITIVTTMIMYVISNNIALSLGMVGALSIIRFRTAVKDVRDAAFIFWGIAVGIGCGVSQFLLVGAGSITMFLFLILTRQAVPESKQLLIVRGRNGSQNKIEAAVDAYFTRGVRQTMKNASEEGCEIIYSLSEGTVQRARKKNMVDVVERLMKIEGVTNVNLVEQLEDIGR